MAKNQVSRTQNYYLATRIRINHTDCPIKCECKYYYINIVRRTFLPR